jgi:hypothetical protein
MESYFGEVVQTFELMRVGVVQIFELMRVGVAPKDHPFTPLVRLFVSKWHAYDSFM